jgi:AraC family transcriptional regulator of adaptative response / DNA-3-methyladenine glycosylase II
MTHLAEAPSLGLGMPASRLGTLKAVARAAAGDPNLFRSSGSVDEAVDRLKTIPGIGDWTAQYIALRALREVDAFPASDVGLLRGAAKIAGSSMTPKSLLQRAESWRPWRAYAAQHLWAAASSSE